MKTKTERIAKLIKQWSKLKEDYPDTRISISTPEGHAVFEICDTDIDYVSTRLSYIRPSYDVAIDFTTDEGIY